MDCSHPEDTLVPSGSLNFSRAPGRDIISVPAGVFPPVLVTVFYADETSHSRWFEELGPTICLDFADRDRPVSRIEFRPGAAAKI